MTGDGRADIVLRGPAHEVVLWGLDGSRVNYAPRIGSVDNSYWLLGVPSDTSGDGHADILWRGRGGENVVWLLDDISNPFAAALPGLSAT